MSLVVWLPLNGDSKNQGTKQYKETINTLEYTSNGKTTNKCVNSGRLQYDKNPLGMVGSICFWIYPKSADEGGNGKAQIIFGRHDSGKGERKWTLYMFPDNKSLHSWGCQKDGSKDPNGDFTLTGVLKESAWNHVCVAHDLDYEYVYINGVLKRKIKWDSNGTFTFDVGTPIIYGDYYNDEANYRLNDFRIYNHCLTQSEVSEIAKGLMLHYSFENPYAEETTNIPHSLTLTTDKVTMGIDSIGKYIIKPTGLEWYDGLKISPVIVKPGRYYTWSIEVMSPVDCQYTFDTNSFCDSSAHSGNDMHFVNGRAVRSSEVWEIKGGVLSPTRGRLEAYKWTKVWTTVKITSECSNPSIFHSICPVDVGNSIKMYYRNSMLEESPYPTPYTSSNREAGLIRDNSGMGNDGTQVYQREEIPIISSPVTGNGNGVGNLTITENSGTYTITNFNSGDNQCVTLGKINYNSKYHYLNSLVSYEFDITLKNLVMADGKTLSDASSSNNYPSMMQGMVHFKDGTSIWTNAPVSDCVITKRLNDGKTANGTFHICHEKKITNQACLTNASYYDLGFRFNYVKSGTIIISNVHAYYGSLDTSTLSLSDNSAIGTHSAYFNGKNRINCGVVTPDYMDELTLSCWIYQNDWTNTNFLMGKQGSIAGTNFTINNVGSGGFGFKTENGVNKLNLCTKHTDQNWSTDCLFDYTTLSPGWHLFTGVATKNKKQIYVDGELKKEVIHNNGNPIINCAGSYKAPFSIGGEICKTDPSNNLVDVHVDDVRLYSTALSDEDIKALYNVKAKIDNKSNLYCNQLVETKSENMMKPMNEVDLDNDLSKFYSSGTFSCKDNILKYTISTSNTNYNSGMYIRNVNYGGPLIDNLEYRCTFYVKVSKTGTYVLGEERLGCVIKTLESGKWYYIKQEAKATGSSKNLIIYNASKNLVAGDTMEVRDVQIYRLYNDENYNPGPNIKGQYKTFELNETFNEDVENSGATIVDKYGAEWLEVFYHNTNNNTVWFTDEQEALHTNSQFKFSILDQLKNFRGADNKFEFLLEYPQDLPGQYNRWKQTDNPALVQELFSSTPSPASGYEAIHVDWTSNVWGGLLKSQKASTSPSIRTFIDGSVNHNNWYYSIGCYNNRVNDWENAMPGPNNTPSTGMKEVHLYVRIDNLPNKNEIFRQYKRQTKTKEIIEI